MTLDENKALVRRFIDEIFVQGRVDAVDELLADDFVSHTWRSTGDGRGDLRRAMGRLSTGRTYRIGEIHIFRIRDGRVIEHWHQDDQLGMMRQLGAMPG